MAAPKEQFEIIAKTLYGLEEVLAGEIEAIGGEDIKLFTRAVRYRGDQSVLYKSNYLLRTAIRILKPIGSFKIFNDHQLYRHVKRIPWEKFLLLQNTFAIDAVTNSAIFRNSKYIALKSKDAVVDRMREVHGQRPDVDTQDPDVKIHIHIDDKMCTVSLDSSGASLDKRGYKTEHNEAPLSEVLAAGIITLSGWDRRSTYIDPMCGSGTLVTEAALMALNIPPGKWRRFAFEKWSDFDRLLWKQVCESTKETGRPDNVQLYASDIDPEAVRIATSNARRAGVDGVISFSQQDFLESEPEADGGVLIVNPPYGERLEDADEMLEFYAGIGSRLKHFYPGRDAWIFSSNMAALKRVGLRTSRRIKLYNGPLECRLYKYELYRGSKKGG